MVAVVLFIRWLDGEGFNGWLKLVSMNEYDHFWLIIRNSFKAFAWTLSDYVHDAGIGGGANYSFTKYKTKHKNRPIKNHIYIFISYVTCHVFIALCVPPSSPFKRLNLCVFVTSLLPPSRRKEAKSMNQREPMRQRRLLDDGLSVICLND